MPYLRAGRSGLLLPKISLGLWQNFGEADPIANCRAILRRAFDLGITHFDLSNNYGPPVGAAETTFGRLHADDFRSLRRELVISTKAGWGMWPGPYGDWGSRKYMLANLDDSLRRMKLDYVDIFYSHCPDPETPMEETMGALAQAVRSGKALYAGISTYPPDQAREAARILRDLGTPCLMHQPHYSMLDRKIESELLPMLQSEGIGCIVFSPLDLAPKTGHAMRGRVPSKIMGAIIAVSLALLSFGSSVFGVPILVPDGPTLPLDEVGCYSIGYRLRGEAETRLPDGWTGGLDSPTGAACQPAGIQHGKAAWLLHCPWRGKTGVTFQDFTFTLPGATPVTLCGETALRADAVGQSDGVVFRIFVNGAKRFESNRMDAEWQRFAIDLTADAGKTVTLRFETDPGPRDDANHDFALWAERRLEMPGLAPSPAALHPAPPPLDLRRLASQQNGSVVPLSGFTGKTEVQVTSAGAVLRYTGNDGTLEYRWIPGDGDPLMGKVILHAGQAASQPREVPLATQARLEWTANATPTASRLIALPGQGAVLTKTYAVGGTTATLTVTATLQGKSLVFDFSCDEPLVRALDGGGWGPVARRRSIGMPYDSLPVLFLDSENLFAGVFLDWTASQASSHAGTRAVYDARTDGSRNLLRERLIYTAAWHLDETLPNIPNAPSPYRADLSNRIVLDIWGDRFAPLQQRLHALVRDGPCGPAVALVHNWQFGGYDNKLPRHVPANPALGGDPALVALVQEGERDGIHMALHENYVDDYPNAPDFAETDIARATDGSRVKAWFNPDTKIQSFAVKPTHVLPLAKTQGPEVRRRYGGSACYLDVHSSVPPWFHVDFESGQPDAGEFRASWDAHRALWAYERDLHKGPVFGEGNSHWYWSGLLDGVEAQFGQGWPDNAGTSAPLLVDFDLLKIHPLQLNHGMGYYQRWWSHGPDAEHPLLALLDQYRAQEAAYGHEAFLGGEAWHDAGYVWLESHLLPPLTARTALAPVVAIEYEADGKWLDASAVVRARGDFSRVRVRYEGGLTVWANGAEHPWQVDDATLPPNGWMARGSGLNAGTLLRQGVVSDLADTPESVFVNARPDIDWKERGLTRVMPAVAEFKALGPRVFRVTYRWAASQPLKGDYDCFVHFFPVDANAAHEPISFQQDHPLVVPTSQWKSGFVFADGPWDITVPASTAPGDYLCTVGLYRTDEGRLTLQGRSDGHQRMILGTLHVAQDGTLGFTSAPSSEATASGAAATLDFGCIWTDGSVLVRREGSDWALRPFPDDRPFTVELDVSRFGAPATAQVVNGWWRLALTGQPVYRWPAPK